MAEKKLIDLSESNASNQTSHVSSTLHSHQSSQVGIPAHVLSKQDSGNKLNFASTSTQGLTGSASAVINTKDLGGSLAPGNDSSSKSNSIYHGDGTFALPNSMRGNTHGAPPAGSHPSQPPVRWSVPNPLAEGESTPAALTGDPQGVKQLPHASMELKKHHLAPSLTHSLPNAASIQPDRSKVAAYNTASATATGNRNPPLNRPPQAFQPQASQNNYRPTAAPSKLDPQLRSFPDPSIPQSVHLYPNGTDLSSSQPSDSNPHFPRVATTYAEMKAQREIMKQRHDQDQSTKASGLIQTHRPPQNHTAYGDTTYLQQPQPQPQPIPTSQPQVNLSDYPIQAQAEILRRRQLQLMEQNPSQFHQNMMLTERGKTQPPTMASTQPKTSLPTQLHSEPKANVLSQQQILHHNQQSSLPQLLESQGSQGANQAGKIQLSSEGRQALTRAIFSALQSPSGDIEPSLLQKAVQTTGLKASAIISAGVAAKHREQLKKLATLSSTSDGLVQDEMPQVAAPLSTAAVVRRPDIQTVPPSTRPGASSKPVTTELMGGKITVVGGHNIITSKGANIGSIPTRSVAPPSSTYIPGSYTKVPFPSSVARQPIDSTKLGPPPKPINTGPISIVGRPSLDTGIPASMKNAFDFKRSLVPETSSTVSSLPKLPAPVTAPRPTTNTVIQPYKPAQPTIPLAPHMMAELTKWKRAQQAMFLSNAATVKGINFTHKVAQTPSWSVAPLTMGAVVRCADQSPASPALQSKVSNGTYNRLRLYSDFRLLKKAACIQKAIKTSSPMSSIIEKEAEFTIAKNRNLVKSSINLLDLTDKYKRLKLQPRKVGNLLERNLRKNRITTCDSLNRKLKEINKSILSHSGDFFKFHRNRKMDVSRLARSVRDFITDKAKKKDKDEDNAERARLAALRANDMVAYTALLEEKRNDRLKFLLDKTGDFMNQISGMIKDKRINDEEGTADIKLMQREMKSENNLVLEAIDQSYYSSTHVKNETVKQPSILVGGNLKEYQIAGLQWLVSLYNNRLNGILADEMGLGKTVQTIALISYLMEYKDNRGPYLVIVPLSTMSNWVNEFRRWCPSVTVVVFKGTPNQRKELYKNEVREGHFNVLLTTYEYIIRDKASLRKIRWQYAIVDEGHRMKNSHSKFSVTLGTQYNTSHRLLLTGTPLQNNLPELWSLLNFLLPDIFNSVETFDQWFNKPFSQFGAPASETNGEEVLSNEERLLIINRLHELLRPFMLRRIKADVLDQLPDKIERVLRCELSSWQKALYRQISYQVLENGTKSSARGLNNVAMQLRKVCNHPYMFSQEGYFINENIIRTSGKVELLDRMLPKLKAAGHRILMFFQMTAAMTILEDYFKYRGYLTLRLDGSTPGEEREKRMALFNAQDSPYFIFMLSTRAGGLGLNLASADTVIIFDSDWNVTMMDLQAQDRAHRIGQKKIVIVFRLVSNSPVEEKILSRATEKLNMSEIIVEAGRFDKSSVEEDTSEERLKLMELLLTDFDTNPKVATSTLPSSDDEGEGDQDGDEDETEIDFNELLSRNDDDYELYRQIDTGQYKSPELFESAGLLTDPQDIPDWIRYPNGKPENQVLFDATAGRKSTKVPVLYNDGLTERQFIKLIEKQADDDEAAMKEKKRQSSSKDLNPQLDSLNDRLISICKSVIALKEEKTKRRLSDIFREKPCPQTYPDYYSIIKNPIAINDIMQKCRSKSYSSVSEFLNDWDLMFTNAKTYNGEGSWIVLDSVDLEAELKRLLTKNNLLEVAEPPKSTLRIKFSLKSTNETAPHPEPVKRKATQSLSPKSVKKARAS